MIVLFLVRFCGFGGVLRFGTWLCGVCCGVLVLGGVWATYWFPDWDVGCFEMALVLDLVAFCLCILWFRVGLSFDCFYGFAVECGHWLADCGCLWCEFGSWVLFNVFLVFVRYKL